jgi:hypothetical protein
LAYVRKRKRLGFLGSLFLAAGIAEGDGGAHLKTYHPNPPSPCVSG